MAIIGVRLGVIGVICWFCFGLGMNISNPHRPGMKLSPLRVSASGPIIGQGAAGDKAVRAGVSRITIVSRLSGQWFRYTLPPNNTNNTKPDPNLNFIKQFRVIVKQLEQIGNRSHGSGFAVFITGKCICSSSCDKGGL